MAISDKLTYLGETKSILKDTINMSNANITNSTTFRNYATQLKEGYIDILNNGTDTLYNNFTHLTGKGTTLSFAPTYQAPMKITCYGSTSQASTPTPSSPVDVVNTTGNQTISVSDGTNTDTYNIGLGNIELCKIGDYEDKIDKSTGKNLFDGEIELGGINPANGTLLPNTDRTRSKNYIKVEPNTTYRFTRMVGNYRWIIGYKNDKTGITDGGVSGYDSALASVGSSTKTFTFTTSPTTEYIKWYDTNTTDLTEQVMINLGDTALPYEPYGTDWYLKKNIDKVVNEIAAIGTLSSGYVYGYKNALWNNKKIGTFGGICNKALFSTDRTPNTFYENDRNFAFVGDTNDTLETMQEKYNGADIYYVLATPTYTKITDSTLIEQLEAIKSKDNTTNITSSMVIGAVALKKE